MRHSVLTPFFGRLRDRFCEYHEPLAFTEKLERASRIPGVEGVEIIFPDECSDAREARPALSEYGLEVAAVNVNLKGKREFVRGALTSADPGVRAEAVSLLQQGKQLAAELGVGRVTCAPLADGYDYPFQTHYGTAWGHLVETVGAAAAFMPEVALHLEHKPSDPRIRGFADTAAKVLWLCRQIGAPNLGITFNMGHALYGGGVPAADFCHVLASGVPYYIHYCDATPDWDWDLTAGSRHYWQLVEFLFYLRQDGYQGWMTADTFPVRQNATEMFATNIRVLDRIWERLEGLDSGAVVSALKDDRAMPMMRELERCFPIPE